MGRVTADATSGAYCYIEMLGGLTVHVGEQVTTRFKSQKDGAVLAYLAYRRGQRIPREVLADLFWPDSNAAQGRNSLSTALSGIRRVLEPATGGAPAGSIIESDYHTVGVNAQAVDTDVARLERALQAARRASSPAEKSEHLRIAASLHVGPLLPGQYEPWVGAEREWLATATMESLEHLTREAERAGDITTATDHARRMVEIDPLSEVGHCSLVHLLAVAGQTRGVADYCREWEGRLRELGAEEVAEAMREAAAAPVGDTSPSAPEHRFSSPVHFGVSRPDRGGKGAPTLIAPSEPMVPVRVVAPLVPTVAPLSAPATAPSTAPLALLPPLPVYPSPLIGRQHELEDLQWRLGGGGARLVTLTGPAGVGKTRLAIAAIQSLLPPPPRTPQFPPDRPDRDDFLDDLPGNRRRTEDISAFYVLTEGVSDASTLADAILEAVQARLPADSARPSAEAGIRPLERLASVLNGLGRRAVLLLDGFEHLSEMGAEVVEELLLLTERVTILVTSRRRLLVTGEHVVPIVPLAVPSGSEDPEELIRRWPVVALFRDRAQMARPGFEVTPRNVAAVAALVARLEGLPLAVELAAARSQVLTPAQMLEQLNNARPLDLLATRGGTRPGGRVLQRHRSLRDAISWSVRLLSPELRRVFAQLSVLEAGWSLTDAAAICDPLPDAEDDPLTAMLDAVSYLVDASLVQAEPASDSESGDEEMHFRVLSALRAFGEELLVSEENDGSDCLTLRTRHARHYSARAREAEALRRSQGETAYLDAIARDYANLRVVLERSAEEIGDTSAALECATTLRWYWLTRGRLSEGRVFLEAALSSGEKEGNTASLALLAAAHNAAGVLAGAQGVPAAGREHYERAYDLSRAARDSEGAAIALNNLAILHSQAKEWYLASERYGQSLEYWRKVGDRAREGTVLANLAGIALLQEDLVEADRQYAESLTIARDLKDKRGIATRLRNLARIAFRRGDYQRSSRLLSEALEDAAAMDDRPGIAHCLLRIGLSRRGEGGERERTAPLLVGAGLRLFESCGAPVDDWERQDLATWSDLEKRVHEAGENFALPELPEALSMARASEPPTTMPTFSTARF
jgi:predicted ATPase/DNA-binding SARP family transcriptional activator